MAFNVGETVGDYQIIGILGAGGMGKVYKVRNVISDRVEAMKVLLPNLAQEGELADRFVREIKLLASLNHPNIAQLHTALRQENQLLMIMEFVEGRTLEDRLKDGPVALGDAVGYACQALAALGYAHERGVVHRDIKPANMMLTAAGEIKLMDFGIAKAVADRRLTMTGTTLGSLYYMSPEQVKGSADLDGRSDLYSVGVSLYELVTGTRPFKGDSDYSIMVAHLEQTPVPLVQLDPKFPPALNEIILTAIEKDPANRFQTANAFRAALESVLPSLPRTAPVAPVATVTAAQPLKAPQASAPPPPASAMFAQPQQPPVPPAAAAAPRSSGHRGLWMALGAVAAIAIIAVAAVQLPRWYRTRAGGEAAPAQSTAPVAAPAETSGPVAAPGAVAVAPPAAAPATAAVPAAVPSAVPPSAPASARGRAAAAKSAAPSQSYSPAPPAAPASHAPAAGNAPPAADTAALDAARDRLADLAPRANALNSTLKNLEQQQRAMGVGLRTDISTSWRRMEQLLDDAEAAIKGKDPARAGTKLDQAERELDKLDKFLGH
jgi:serine/threonine-protein kinase